MRKLFGWVAFLGLFLLAWYDRLARALGWLAAKDDFEQYVAKPWREDIWPILDRQVIAMLTWTDTLLGVATLGLIWLYFGDRIAAIIKRRYRREEGVKIKEGTVALQSQRPDIKRFSNHDREELSGVIATIYRILTDDYEPACDFGRKLVDGWKDRVRKEGKEDACQELRDFLTEISAVGRQVHAIIKSNDLYINEFRPLLEGGKYQPELGTAINELRQALLKLEEEPTDGVLDLFEPYNKKLRDGMSARYKWCEDSKNHLRALKAELQET